MIKLRGGWASLEFFLRDVDCALFFTFRVRGISGSFVWDFEGVFSGVWDGRGGGYRRLVRKGEGPSSRGYVISCPSISLLCSPSISPLHPPSPCRVPSAAYPPSHQLQTDSNHKRTPIKQPERRVCRHLTDLVPSRRDTRNRGKRVQGRQAWQTSASLDDDTPKGEVGTFVFACRTESPREPEASLAHRHRRGKPPHDRPKRTLLHPTPPQIRRGGSLVLPSLLRAATMRS